MIRPGVAVLLLAMGAAAVGVGAWGEIESALYHGPTGDLDRKAGFIFAAIPLTFGLGLCFLGVAVWRRRT